MHHDLVDRVFTAPTPNAVWLTDITEHPSAEGKRYLCAIKDIHPGRIAGYSMDVRMTAALAVTELRNAIALRTPADTIVHSDRAATHVAGVHRGADRGRHRRLDWLCRRHPGQRAHVSTIGLCKTESIDRQRSWTGRNKVERGAAA